MTQSKDFQIGDYIFANSLHDSSHAICKVLELEQKQMVVRCGIWNQTCSYEQVTPIPITLEILEKNGFKLTKEIWVLYDKSWRIYIQYSNDKWSIDVRNEIVQKDNLGRADLVSFIRDWMPNFYVHELQHAMRLCGISKDIEL